MNIEPQFEKIPPLLSPLAKQHWQRFITVCSQKNLTIPYQQEFFASLPRIFALSEFVVNACCRSPEIICDLVLSNELFIPYKETYYSQALSNLFASVVDENDLIKKLRWFRKREMVRIAWRDLSGWATLQETIYELSKLADASIDQTLQLLQQWQCAHYDYHTDKQLVVIAVGKLGANELNFSSDIDLIFTFSRCEEISNQTVDQHHFFTLLAQRLIKVLSTITEAGFVFRVDTRLRPFGASGVLVLNSISLQQYYQQHGRDWERYALSRARIVSGDAATIKETQKIILTFVYRHYLDYSVIESLRQMKKLIRRESHGVNDDIKRGEGGIREIEFIIQVVQLIRGGKESWLQKTSILHLLPLLAEKNYLTRNIVLELIAAYGFFRCLENRLQAFADQQTQTLPKDEIGKVRLAFAMDSTNWDALSEQIISHRKKVKQYFEATVATPKISNKIPDFLLSNEDLHAWIENKMTIENCNFLLSQFGFEKSQIILNYLHEFNQSQFYLSSDKKTKQQLQLLIVQLLPLIANTVDQELTLKRILSILEVIVNNTIYLILLLENPNSWIHLISLCSSSPWLAAQITYYPFLLEELLDNVVLTTPHSIKRLEDELQQYLLPIPEEDLVLQIEYLRRFKLIQVLRVAVADLKKTLPLMKISDHLTFTASAILRYAQQIAWHYLVARHGRPCLGNKPLTSQDFAIIGYGKLGGIELAYGSDLDLVFLYPDVDMLQMTDSAKPISNIEFFVRLAQRIIHILGETTSVGVLYSVDTRLRPSGASGLLVSSISAFAEYQMEKAWTWEHQALIRARVITGSNHLQNQFEAIRQQVLTRLRDSKKLVAEVLTMREKMRQSAIKTIPGMFDIMQGLGGIKDIEFLVQFIVLNWSHQFPSLIEYTDNIRILESINMENLLPKDDAELLCDAYRAFRAVVHRTNLQNLPALIPEEELLNYRQMVVRIWQEILQ
jgi:glutamate-ammonia-ligase adenylyltransferase